MAGKLRRVIAVLLCITSVMIVCLPSEQSYASVQVGNYEIDGDTLIKYTGSDDIITLPNTIRSIGKDAFSGNKSLIKVIIPNSVSNIDFAAFENCTNLIQVVIPESVRAIGSSAFSGCEQLQYVNIPAKCESVGSAAFAKCGKLANIEVSPGNKNYVCVDGVLYTIDGKKVEQYLAGRTRSSYNMPSTVEVIEEYAFWGAPQLADISLSSKLKEIPEYAFANCSGLTNVTLPYNIESLMAYSFSDCYNLKNVVVPDSVGYIDEKAFYLTNNVTVNYYDSDEARKNVEAAGVPEENFAEYIGSVSSNSYDINVSGSAGEKTYINQMPYVSSMTPDYSDNKLPGELASSKIVGGTAMLMIPRDVRIRGVDLETIENEDGTPYAFADGSKGGDYSIIGGNVAKYRGNNADVVLPQGIQKIGNRCFYKKESIKNVVIPAGVSDIGDFAFARSGIEKAEIPEGTQNIGYAAFYNCPELKDVKIPGSVKRIELGAFEGTPWLSSKLGSSGEDFLVVGDGILLGYGGNGGSVSIPNGVRTIAPGCFSGNTNISGVVLPQGLTTIGEDAFNGCSGIHEIVIPESVIDIEDRAFKDCSLDQVIIPPGVKRIGLGAFDRSGVQDTVDKKGAVVFLGEELPRISYKNTATRLSAGNLRKLPFEGFDNVIIGNDVEITDNSILSPKKYGFRGQVYTITSDQDEDSGTLRLISSASDKVGQDGNVVIDPHVVINGKKYIMTGVSAGAFEPYENIGTWSDEEIKGVSIAGNTSRDLKNMLASINNMIASTPKEERAERTDDGARILPVNMDPALSPDKDTPFAAISDSDGNFNIDITSAQDRSGSCLQAFKERYGTTNVLMVPIDITMRDNTTGLPITRLSGRKVDMELPIPGALITSPVISVGALNDNGMLEEVSSEIINHGGNDKIRFVAQHFSTYVLYVKPDITVIQSNENVETMSAPTQNAVVRTLNRNVGSVQIKWYVAIILISMAAILFLYKGKKKRA